MDFRGAGLKPSEIMEKLYHEYGIARTTEMIKGIIRQKKRKRIKHD